jgi:hypothetical protein
MRAADGIARVPCATYTGATLAFTKEEKYGFFKVEP